MRRDCLLPTLTMLAIAGIMSVEGTAQAEGLPLALPTSVASPLPRLSLSHLDLTPREGQSATEMIDWSKVETAAWLSIFEDEARSRDRRPDTSNPGTGAWFRVAPRTSFIARDWGESKSLAGTRLSTTESMRLTRSSRMLVTRVQLGEGRVAPFVQLGFGQWRTDPYLMPNSPRNTELAAHGGLGVDIEVLPSMLPDWRIGAETALTWIYRDVKEVQNVDETKIVSVMVASKLTF